MRKFILMLALVAVALVAVEATAVQASEPLPVCVVGDAHTPGFDCVEAHAAAIDADGGVDHGIVVNDGDGFVGLLISVFGVGTFGALGMAVVTGPLMSMTASGKFGETLVFDKRGFVRQLVIPTNPQSDAQGNVRQILLAVQKALTVLGETVINAVKTVAPVSYRWNSYLLSQSLGPASADYAASKAAFAALSGPEQTTWNDEAEGKGILERSVLYATDDAITAGLALFAISRALFALGLNVVAGAPGAANADDWADYFVS
jgi:hypothetical protein